MSPRGCRFLGVLLGALLSLGAAKSFDRLPSEKETWRRVDTPNFVVFGNASPRQLVEAARRLEKLRQVLQKTTRGFKTESSIPTYFYVFKSTESYEPYNLGPDGKPSSRAGYFLGSSDANYVTMDASGDVTPYEIVFHEYIHFVLNNSLRNLPTWLNEGLAEFYSNVTPSSDGKTAEVGLAISHHVRALRHGGLLDMNRLFEIDGSSPEYNEGERQGAFYAQSWALTHWLAAGPPERRAMLTDLLNRLNKGEPEREAFRAAIPIPPETLRKEIAAYAQQSTFPFITFTFDEAMSKEEARAVPISRAEALYRLGDLLAHVPPIRYESAEAHLRAVLALEPDHVGAKLTQAWLDRNRKRWDRAEAAYRALLPVGGRRAKAQYASMLLDRFDEEGPAEGSEDVLEALLRARSLFREVLAEAPNDVHALAGFGSTFAGDEPDVAEGMAALARAYDLMPSRPEPLAMWIGLAARSGEVDAAWEALERGLRRSQNHDLVRHAEETIAAAERRRADEALAEGREEDAKAILESTSKRLQDPRVRDALAKSQAEPRRISDSSETVELYNRAIEAANRQAWAEALEMLDGVIREARDPGLREAAESARKEMARIEAHNRIVGRFNAAIDAANRGDLAAAVRGLEALLAEERDWEPEMRERVERTLADLRKARGRSR